MPGLELSLFFRSVRDSVLRQTNGRQEPYVFSSLSAEPFYFYPRPPNRPPVAGRNDHAGGARHRWADTARHRQPDRPGPGPDDGPHHRPAALRRGAGPGPRHTARRSVPVRPHRQRHLQAGTGPHRPSRHIRPPGRGWARRQRHGQLGGQCRVLQPSAHRGVAPAHPHLHRRIGHIPANRPGRGPVDCGGHGPAAWPGPQRHGGPACRRPAAAGVAGRARVRAGYGVHRPCRRVGLPGRGRTRRSGAERA